MKNILKMLFGGDFQSGVYAEGGSLEAHGIHVGDTFLKTISGVVQKVKDKNGNIVYINLATGERKSKPLLLFDEGGDFQSGVYAGGGFIESKVDKLYKKSNFINDDNNWKLKLLEMLQDSSIEAYNIYQSLNKIQKEEVLQELYIMDNDMGSYGDEDIETSKENLSILLADAKNGKKYDEGGEVTYFLNKDGIKVRSKVEPKEKLSEKEWMAKHNDSKEARTYGFGGLFGKAKEIVKPTKYPQLEGKQVVLKSGEYVQVLTQEESSLMVMDLNKLGTGVKPRKVSIYDVDMTSFANGGALIGNQKRIDMNKNGKIDAEDFKLLRSSMNGAWRNERKHVNHNEDYEVRYAKPRPNRTGYKGKRNFATGGAVNKDIEINPTIKNFIDKLKKEGKYNKGNEQKNVNGILYRFDEYKLMNPSGFVVNQFKRIVEQNYGVLSLSNGYDFRKINLKDNKVIYANLPKYKGGFTDYITFRELVILNKTGGEISNFERLSRVVAKNYEGKRVKPQYQKEYGKVYSKSEAKEVGNKVAGKVKSMKKAESGTSVKKETRGGVMVLAKKIRKDGESWKDALKRAGQQLK